MEYSLPGLNWARRKAKHNNRQHGCKSPEANLPRLNSLAVNLPELEAERKEKIQLRIMQALPTSCFPPISCHFLVIFQCTESSKIPVLSQVAPYCDIMNCVTGALRRRKGWKWTWLFIKTPEGSLKPQFWAYEVFSWWNVSLYGTFVRACLAPTHRSHTTRSTMSRIIHTIMAPTEEREEIKILQMFKRFKNF